MVTENKCCGTISSIILGTIDWYMPTAKPYKNLPVMTIQKYFKLMDMMLPLTPMKMQTNMHLRRPIHMIGPPIIAPKSMPNITLPPSIAI